MNMAHQLRALGKRDLLLEIEVAGRTYRLVTTFKHSFMSAVGLYRSGPDRVVLKRYREESLMGLPTRWAGRLMADYEAAVLRQVHDLNGIPRLIERRGPTGLVREFVPGDHLTRRTRVGDEFFPQLVDLLREIHRRGLAYVDLEKPANILVGGDGRPYLIDLQIAFYVPERMLGRTALVRWFGELLQRSDLYHVRKHWRRVRPDQLTSAQTRRSRCKPWPVMLGNVLITPLKKLRRRLRGRS